MTTHPGLILDGRSELFVLCYLVHERPLDLFLFLKLVLFMVRSEHVSQPVTISSSWIGIYTFVYKCFLFILVFIAARDMAFFLVAHEFLETRGIVSENGVRCVIAAVVREVEVLMAGNVPGVVCSIH